MRLTEMQHETLVVHSRTTVLEFVNTTVRQVVQQACNWRVGTAS